MKTLKGQKIVRIYTLNTQYANNQVELEDDRGNIYRMPTSTIIQMVNEFEFEIEKKRVYNHLVRADLLETPIN